MPDSPQRAPWGLYISIPFCRFKCTYCNFASGVFAPAQLDEYIEALRGEIRAGGMSGTAQAGNGRPGGTASPQGAPRQADTVYLGGGTPSMLTPAQAERLFGEIRAGFDIAECSEITIEAAPGSITAELASAWRGLGINRVSLGVQSFVERELRAVGRPHRAATVASEIALLRAAGIARMNVDLIAGLPYQTPVSWNESLDWVARLRPEHVSVYLLEVDEDSRLGAEVLAGGRRYSAESLPGEDTLAELYSHAVERLGELGYRQYEISNFALHDCESRHNRKYWEGEPYLGYGVDAHSYDGRERWANTDSLDRYLEAARRGGSPVVVRTPVDDRRRAEERIFLGLRENRGIELSESEQARYRGELDRMTRAGLLEFADGRLRLTRRGRLLSNEVFAEFIG